jgi:hypothetical protein
LARPGRQATTRRNIKLRLHDQIHTPLQQA